MGEAMGGSGNPWVQRRAGEPTNAQKMGEFGRELFLGYDQQRMIGRFGLESDDGYLYLDYVGDPYRVDRGNGRIDVHGEGDRWISLEEKPYTALAIYDMLCHFQDQDTEPLLAGEFCPTKSLTSMVSTPSAPQGYGNLDALSGHVDELAAACEAIGGELQSRMARADITYLIPVFEWFDVIFQFWDGDEEFAPKTMFLWDRNSLQFMHFETLYYVMQDVMGKLWSGFRAYPEDLDDAGGRMKGDL